MLLAAEPESVQATVATGGGPRFAEVEEKERRAWRRRRASSCVSPAAAGYLHLQLRCGRRVCLSPGRDERHPADGCCVRVLPSATARGRHRHEEARADVCEARAAPP